jgi:hypothetical protein
MILTCGLTWVGISGRCFLCERTSRYLRVASGDDGVSATDGGDLRYGDLRYGDLRYGDGLHSV